MPVGSHRYSITFEYYSDEEESNGSPASSVQTAKSGGTQTGHLNQHSDWWLWCDWRRNIYRDNNDGVYFVA